MNHPLHLDRRNFLAASAAAGVGLLAGSRAQAAPFKTKLYKAMIRPPTEEAMRPLKDAGFDGIETNLWNVKPEEAAKARKVAETLGMKIHSVLYGWADFDAPDEATVAKYVDEVATALRACEGYGATALLLVPCQRPPLKDADIPKPWDFDIELDEASGHVTRVVQGDNSKYQAYIKAQNLATDASRRVIEEKLIPVAEKTGVIIALENVWNHLWVKPKLFAHFVASFKNRWVQAYFDIGNHVRYAPPEEWLQALGKLTVKLHVKDFKLDPTHKNPQGGDFVHPRDGSINWPAVRHQIEKIGYNDFLTIEDGGLSLAEFSKRLDLIIAAEPAKPIRVGLIGLDTSHVIAFTQILNAPNSTGDLAGVRVVAAYPGGSPDLPDSWDRVKGYTEQLAEMGVEIVPSIDDLLKKVDAVMLESLDGRPHLAQARPVIAAGKPLYIDKPMAASLADVLTIFRLAQQAKVPCFSASALRYGAGCQDARSGKTFGEVRKCTARGPMSIEPHHPDLFWYGVHGVETLFTIMGPGCKTVTRVGRDKVVGQWAGGREGTFEARKDYGAEVVGTKSSGPAGKFDGYKPLVVEVARFFRTGKPPVAAEETIEIFAFMEAADESKRQGGAPVSIESVLANARKAAASR